METEKIWFARQIHNREEKKSIFELWDKSY